MAHRRFKNTDKTRNTSSNQLSLAEKWAVQLGNKVNRGEANLESGTRISILGVDHGGRLILVSEENDTLIVSINIAIPDDVRKKIKTIDKDMAQKILMSLQNQLLSNARTAFMIIPGKFEHLSEITNIVIQQRIRISIKDPSSFNRFGDAIQEVVTVAVKTMLIYGIVSNTQSTSGDQKPPQPPESMYA